jgi:plastocyanin
MAIEGTIPGTRSEETGTSAAAVGPDLRSTAMWLMPIAAIVEVLVTINVIASVGFIPPLLVFAVIFASIAALAIARPRPWVFLTGGSLLLAFVALNFPFAIEGLVHPVGSSHAWTDIIALVAGIAGGVAGIGASVELHRGWSSVRVVRIPLGETLAILVVGALIGTSYVSISGYAALQGSSGLGVANGVTTAPSQTPAVLEAPGMSFTQKALQLSVGAGTVYVVNTDSHPHTFDIDLNGGHLSYALPAGSTTAVVLDLAAVGRYTYWCAIPGHRSSMEGTLEVIE